MAIMRWDPFRELAEMRRAMDRLFEESFGRVTRLLPWEEAAMAIPVDMYETEDNLVVRASLPGVKPEDVDISITGDSLTIRGEAKAKEEVKREGYYRQELRYGACARSLSLPTRVDADKADATFENGILTVTIPKVEEARVKTIKVKAKAVPEK